MSIVKRYFEIEGGVELLAISFEHGSKQKRNGKALSIQICLAIAGLSQAEITVTAQQNLLTVAGAKREKGNRQYMYRGFRLAALSDGGRDTNVLSGRFGLIGEHKTATSRG